LVVPSETMSKNGSATLSNGTPDDSLWATRSLTCRSVKSINHYRRGSIDPVHLSRYVCPNIEDSRRHAGHQLDRPCLLGRVLGSLSIDVDFPDHAKFHGSLRYRRWKKYLNRPPNRDGTATRTSTPVTETAIAGNSRCKNVLVWSRFETHHC
jgi:hypothetical protein